ncbi:hypothetical protein NC981_10325 [Leptolyngbya sp. DQ-M1]|uniref:hypothetical protein n=1 Tax=Leptolyngbya sp. DQ-M1 TaxID=2933920 RepID=UPI003296D644
MKLNPEQVQQAFARLSSENVSVRKIAKDLKVQPSALTYRLKRQFGESYLSLSKGLNFSLLKSLKQDILPGLTESEQVEVQAWMTENLHHLSMPTLDSGRSLLYSST